MHRSGPYTWLVDILQRVNVHPARDVAPLTPRLWKDRLAGNLMTSDVCRAMPAREPKAV
ncbi:MAG: hypothetical protein OXU19_08615 [bacterium]|nr:hypothetical protein [bacterium]